MSPTTDPPGKRRPWRRLRRSTRAAIVVVLVLALEGAAFYAVASTPPLRVHLALTTAPGGGVQAEFEVATGLTPQTVRASLLPGSADANADTTVLVFADTAFPSVFDAPKDTAGIGQRVGAYLTFLHTRYLIQFVDAAGLAAAMGAHPRAALLAVGPGTLPENVFSANSTWLRTWVAGGGTLFWAGGPLGYYAYGPGAGGSYAPAGLGWSGEQQFFGYPVVDVPRPGASGPPVGPLALTPTPLGTALGVAYNGTPYGANVSEVGAHGGVVLGPVAPGTGGAANATSLAYLPVGRGGVFYFGGSIYAPTVGYLPDASVALSEDVALLLDLNYRPSAGTSASATLALGSLASGHLSATVRAPAGGLIAFVRAGVPGTEVVFWSRTVVPPPLAPAALAPADPRARPVGAG